MSKNITPNHTTEPNGVNKTVTASHPELQFSFAKRHGVIMTRHSDTEVYITHQKEFSLASLLELKRIYGCTIILHAVDDDAFEQLLVTHYEAHSGDAMQMMDGIDANLDLQDMADELRRTQDLLDNEDDAPIIRLINALLSQAIKETASDIHIETFEDTLVVRFRVDGVLRQVLTPQRLLAPLLVSRIKVMAKLDISEKRLPQDGRIALKIGGRAIDVRVSTIPAHHGERVVLRLLDKHASRLDFSYLGLSAKNLEILQDCIAKPHGILLVTGPTGAGKSTTLYAGLNALNQVSRNILTVEDPIEYDIKGIGQTQVNPKVDMTFAKGLRAILRQDPDVVMVGEIRDLETAEIAVQASLTGHLVLSTLHTNTAIGAITRLRDMGIEPFLLSSSLVGMVAQRLVRLLCSRCKRSESVSLVVSERIGIEMNGHSKVYAPFGCETCNHTGYLGRSGIYEVIQMDQTLRTMIHEGANEQALTQYVRTQSSSIRDDGWRRVLAGDTSLEEVLRVTTEDG